MEKKYPKVVNCITEDRNGNIWVGTKDGVCRFDWKKFRALSTKKMSNNLVECLFVDNNNIWIGTREVGLYRYDDKTLTAFTEKPVNN